MVWFYIRYIHETGWNFHPVSLFLNIYYLNYPTKLILILEAKYKYGLQIPGQIEIFFPLSNTLSICEKQIFKKSSELNQPA